MARVFYAMGRAALERAMMDGAKLLRAQDATLLPAGTHSLKVLEVFGNGDVLLAGKGVQRLRTLVEKLRIRPGDSIRVHVSYDGPARYVLSDGRHAILRNSAVLRAGRPAEIDQWLKANKIKTDEPTVTITK